MGKKTFPAPWRVSKGADSFAIEDANGVTLAWVNYSADAWRQVSNSLSAQDALTIATGFSQLPALIDLARRVQANSSLTENLPGTPVGTVRAGSGIRRHQSN